MFAVFCLIDAIGATLRDVVIAPEKHRDRKGGFISVWNWRRWLLMSLANVIQIVAAFAILILVHGKGFESRVVSPVQALYTSFVTFTTLGYGDFRPATVLGQILIVTELMFFLMFVLLKVPLAISMVRVKIRQGKGCSARDFPIVGQPAGDRTGQDSLTRL